MQAFFGNHRRTVLLFAVVTGIVFLTTNQKHSTSLRGDMFDDYTFECGAELPNAACGDITDPAAECCDDGSDIVDGYCIDSSADGGECENDGEICWVGTCRGGKCKRHHSYCNRREECDGMGACLPIDFCEKKCRSGLKHSESMQLMS